MGLLSFDQFINSRNYFSGYQFMAEVFSNPALGPVVQSIVSLKSSLKGQLIKYFMTL